MSRDPRELTVGLREDSRAGAHVQVSVFVGRNPGARGRAGTITLRIDEWEDIRLMSPSLTFDLIPPLEESRS